MKGYEWEGKKLLLGGQEVADVKMNVKSVRWKRNLFNLSSCRLVREQRMLATEDDNEKHVIWLILMFK